MKLVFLIFFTVLASISYSQTPIDKNDFNEVLFHKILLEEINQYRSETGLGKLTNNLSLTKAAKDHSTFLRDKKVLTHNQPTTGKRTVQERLLNYVKPTKYTVGENIAQSYILKQSYNYQRDGSTKIYVASTYEKAAEYMLNSWIQSKSHNENLLNVKYELSGLSTYFNAKTGQLTTVHVFARLY